MDKKAMFYAGTPQEDNLIINSKAAGELGNDGAQKRPPTDDDNSSDSDTEVSYSTPLLRSTMASGHNSSYPVSINADPPPESGIATPFRARSRMWAALGSLRRGSAPFDEVSRTPHRCHSRGGFLPEQAGGGVEGRSNDIPENVIMPCGHIPPTCLSRRSRHTSICSITELPVHEHSASATNVSTSLEDGSSSLDSHCHSKIKKGVFDKKARTKLIFASVLCLLFMTGEMVGGLLAHSLAIISDAAHLLTDFASFMISLMALYLAHRPATKKLSFGWYRIEILGAFVSILMLWVLTGILVYSAVQRIMSNDYEIDANVMLITAATGVAFNIVLGTTLHQHSHSHGGHGHSHGGHDHSAGQNQQAENQSITVTAVGTTNYGSIRDVEAADHPEPDGVNEAETSVPHQHGHGHHHKRSNINVKAAFIHVIGDLFQSVGVLVAAFIIYYKPEWKIADPICTFLFSLFVLITTITIMRDILVVLMEGTPRGINFAEVRDTFFQVEGVLDIHNLRVWSLTMDKIALSVHLAVDRKSDPHKVLKMASLVIQQKFNISETTMQVEEYVTEMVDCLDCQGPKL